jgi:peptidoglycan lytic transglycosylase
MRRRFPYAGNSYHFGSQGLLKRRRGGPPRAISPAITAILERGVAHSTLPRQHDPGHRSLPVTAGLPIVPINVTQENLMLRTLTACAFALSTICAANAGQTGMASHYSTRDKNQNGSRTASGRPLRDHELTGAHRSLPFGSKVRVTGSNGRSVVVTITDRGPFVRNRIIDLSMGAARKLGFHGLARVRLSKI